MPRSVFLGCPLPGPGEVLWRAEDRAWALALMEYERDLCPGCGRSRTESTSPDMQDAYDADMIRCHGCAAVAHASEAFHDKPRADPHGIYIAIRPYDD